MAARHATSSGCVRGLSGTLFRRYDAAAALLEYGVLPEESRAAQRKSNSMLQGAIEPVFSLGLERTGRWNR